MPTLFTIACSTIITTLLFTDLFAIILVILLFILTIHIIENINAKLFIRPLCCIDYQIHHTAHMLVDVAVARLKEMEREKSILPLKNYSDIHTGSYTYRLN